MSYNEIGPFLLPSRVPIIRPTIIENENNAYYYACSLCCKQPQSLRYKDGYCNKCRYWYNKIEKFHRDYGFNVVHINAVKKRTRRIQEQEKRITKLETLLEYYKSKYGSSNSISSNSEQTQTQKDKQDNN